LFQDFEGEMIKKLDSTDPFGTIIKDITQKKTEQVVLIGKASLLPPPYEEYQKTIKIFSETLSIGVFNQLLDFLTVCQVNVRICR
jgi:hypothetical protein